jgi:hypothetical protein
MYWTCPGVCCPFVGGSIPDEVTGGPSSSEGATGESADSPSSLWPFLPPKNPKVEVRRISGRPTNELIRVVSEDSPSRRGYCRGDATGLEAVKGAVML